MTDASEGLTPEAQADLIQQIADLIQSRYLDESLAVRMADHLREQLQLNSAALPTDPTELSQAITHLLFGISHDQHVQLSYRMNHSATSVDDLLEQHFRQMQGMNYGIIGLERLAGNIGLLSLRELPPLNLAGDLIHAAMRFLAQMHALIIDLRLAVGGSSDMVQLLVSYLVDEEPQPISGVEWPRRGQHSEQTTLDNVPARRFSDVEVYLLTSGMTHSAAEALIYDLRALKRGIVVGERTRGGAHLTSIIALAHGFVLHLPEGRAHNPITGGNWEKSGITPDVVVPPELALSTANQRALERLLSTATSPEAQDFYTWELEAFNAMTHPVQVSPRLMAGYGGTYGPWQITIGDGGLYARYHTTLKMIPISDTIFMINDSTRLRFVVNEAGSVTRMQVITRDGSVTSVPRSG